MYVGERIGGYNLGVSRDGRQRRTSIEWDQLTPKKGSVQEGGQGKKIERANNTRDRQTKTIVQVCRDTNQEEKALSLKRKKYNRGTSVFNNRLMCKERYSVRFFFVQEK
jgi:hypothetical protein